MSCLVARPGSVDKRHDEVKRDDNALDRNERSFYFMAMAARVAGKGAETKQAILRRVRELMRPDGWLFLGAAETTLGVDDSWERVVVGRSSAYRPLKGN